MVYKIKEYIGIFCFVKDVSSMFKYEMGYENTMC